MEDAAEVAESPAEEEATAASDSEPEDDTVELLGQDDEEGAQDDEPNPSEVGDQPKQTKADGRRTSLLQKMIDEKYAGDEDKFAESLYHQWNSGSETAKELKALRAELAELKAKPTDPEEVFKSDPDLATLGDQRDLLTQELDMLESTAKSIKEGFRAANEALIREKVLEERSDDYEKKDHRAEVRRLEGVIASLNQDWGRLPHEQKRLQLQLKGIDNQIQQAKSAVQTRSKSQKQQQESDEKEQTQFRTQVDGFISQAIKESKLQDNSPTAKRMDTYVRMAIKEVLRGLPDDAPGIDPALAVKHFSDEFLEGLTSHQKQVFKTASTAKNGKSAISQPSPQRTPLPGATRVKASELTKEQIAAHHRKVFNLG